MTRIHMPQDKTPESNLSLSDKIGLLKERKRLIERIDDIEVNGTRGEFMRLGITDKEYKDIFFPAHRSLHLLALKKLDQLRASIREEIETI